MDLELNYDQRQLDLMLKSIQFYENQRMSLYELIGRLEGLHSVLEDVPNTWRDEFQSVANNLELVYASAVDHQESGKPFLTKKDEEDINETIEHLKSLISELYQPSDDDE